MAETAIAYGTTFAEDVDRLIAAGECPPVVMPMPDCWTAYGGSQFIDSAGTGAYMTYLCDELVPFVDERFSTIAAASGRAIQGKSSGGYGALVLAMLRPDLWGGLGDVSGDAAFEHCYLPDVGSRLDGASRARLDRCVLGLDARSAQGPGQRLRRGQPDRHGGLLLARRRRSA